MFFHLSIVFLVFQLVNKFLRFDIGKESTNYTIEVAFSQLLCVQCTYAILGCVCFCNSQLLIQVFGLTGRKFTRICFKM